eukprot:TRINITY_DN11884_c0_g2_i1.p1 TRINITY_DN11884_c0_g2~~TRINITY_DN11884_c0_g2_i1.p1  ORF type:complete len:534 (+),score=128.46 TRINITY_DN11884_c0_g2_i1:92-1603(+)
MSAVSAGGAPQWGSATDVSCTSNAGREMSQERERRQQQESQVIAQLRSRMADRDERMRRMEDRIDAMRSSSPQRADSTPTVFGAPEPVPRRIGMADPGGEALDQLYHEPDSRTPTPAAAAAGRPRKAVAAAPAPVQSGSSVAEPLLSVVSDDGVTVATTGPMQSNVHPLVVEAMQEALYNRDSSSEYGHPAAPDALAAALRDSAEWGRPAQHQGAQRATAGGPGLPSLQHAAAAEEPQRHSAAAVPPLKLAESAPDRVRAARAASPSEVYEGDSSSWSSASPQRRSRGVAAASPVLAGRASPGSKAEIRMLSDRTDKEDDPILGNPAALALTITGGIIAGGCAGWLVGYAIYGATVKGLAAKAVISASASGSAPPVAVSAAAAAAAASAAQAAATKGGGAMAAAALQGSSSAQAAVPHALAAAEGAAATAATTSLQAAGAATLATPFVTPAVAGNAGAGAGSIAIGAAVGGTACGSAVAVFGAVRPQQQPPAVEQQPAPEGSP